MTERRNKRVELLANFRLTIREAPTPPAASSKPCDSGAFPCAQTSLSSFTSTLSTELTVSSKQDPHPLPAPLTLHDCVPVQLSLLRRHHCLSVVFLSPLKGGNKHAVWSLKTFLTVLPCCLLCSTHEARRVVKLDVDTARRFRSERCHSAPPT